jgi:hypothetical protein
MSWPKIRHRWRILLLAAVIVLLILQYCAFPITHTANSGVTLDRVRDYRTNFDTKTHVFNDEYDTVIIVEDQDPTTSHTSLQGVKGFTPRLPRVQRPKTEESAHAKTVREYRQQAVKDAFNHTWTGYSK